VNVFSYEESGDKYVLKVVGGTTSISKDAVMRIERYVTKE
jgi:hypothetical protein